MNFYDTDKKPIAPDASSGIIRFSNVAKKPVGRHVGLTSGDGNLRLVSPQKILSPYVFLVYLALSRKTPDTSVESYAFNYP